MTIYDDYYYDDDDYIYYIYLIMFHCLKCNCLNMSLFVKGQQNTNRTKQQQEQQQQGKFYNN